MPPDIEEKLDKALADFDALAEKIAREEKANAFDKWAKQDAPNPVIQGLANQGEKKTDPDAHKGAFVKALRGMVGLKSEPFTDAERKAMQGDNWEEGGVLLAPQTFVTQVIRAVDDAFVVRRLCTVYSGVSPNGLGVPYLGTDVDDADWTAELTESSTTGVKLGKRELKPKELKKAVLVGRKLLDNTVIDFEAFIQQRIAYKFGKPMESAFMTGDGVNKPLGLFTASTDGISTSRDVDTASNSAIVGDDLVDAFYSLKPQYMERATWLFHRNLGKAIRKLKTSSTGEYIWQPFGMVGNSLQGNTPGTILGRPFVMSEFAPSTISAGNYLACVGDFSFYWVADGESLRVQRLNELYARTSQIGYHVEASCDAMPVHEEAFIRLKFKS